MAYEDQDDEREFERIQRERLQREAELERRRQSDADLERLNPFGAFPSNDDWANQGPDFDYNTGAPRVAQDRAMPIADQDTFVPPTVEPSNQIEQVEQGGQFGKGPLGRVEPIAVQPAPRDEYARLVRRPAPSPEEIQNARLREMRAQGAWEQEWENASPNHQRAMVQLSMQARLQQITLTQAEAARMDRLRNAMGDIASLVESGELTPAQAAALHVQYQTGLNPLLQRTHEIDQIRTRMQAQAIQQRMTQEAEDFKNQQTWTNSVRSGLPPPTHNMPDGSQYVETHPGRLTQTRPPRGTMTEAQQAAAERAERDRQDRIERQEGALRERAERYADSVLQHDVTAAARHPLVNEGQPRWYTPPTPSTRSPGPVWGLFGGGTQGVETPQPSFGEQYQAQREQLIQRYLGSARGGQQGLGQSRVPGAQGSQPGAQQGPTPEMVQQGVRFFGSTLERASANDADFSAATFDLRQALAEPNADLAHIMTIARGIPPEIRQQIQIPPAVANAMQAAMMQREDQTRVDPTTVPQGEAGTNFTPEQIAAMLPRIEQITNSYSAVPSFFSPTFDNLSRLRVQLLTIQRGTGLNGRPLSEQELAFFRTSAQRSIGRLPPDVLRQVLGR